MITIISGTNRPNNNSIRVARIYEQLLHEKGEETSLITLQDLPKDFLISEMYGERTPDFDELLKKFLEPSEKLIFIAPEYNGSIAGVLKLFLDSIDPNLFYGKKAALVGISAGFNGNLRGLDHLTGILHYLQVEVLSFKVKVSFVNENLDPSGKITNDRIQKDIDHQVERLVKF